VADAPLAAAPASARASAKPGVAFSEVSAQGLTKLYGRHRALGGVDLTVGAGRLCALLGPNGAGKSTLLGILSTLVRPTSGTVRFTGAGAEVDAHDARAAIGLLAHEPMVYGELSALENLRFFAALYGVAGADARARALLDEVGLANEARTRPARTYSRGMMQRLALARALLPGPNLLLLDEPFTGLDRAGVTHLVAALEKCKSDGRLVIVVSHDLDALGGLVDQLAVIRRGKIVHDEARQAPLSTAELKDIYYGVSE
jgi:heme exporter protein A